MGRQGSASTTPLFPRCSTSKTHTYSYIRTPTRYTVTSLCFQDLACRTCSHEILNEGAEHSYLHVSYLAYSVPYLSSWRTRNIPRFFHILDTNFRGTFLLTCVLISVFTASPVDVEGAELTSIYVLVSHLSRSTKLKGAFLLTCELIKVYLVPYLSIWRAQNTYLHLSITLYLGVLIKG